MFKASIKRAFLRQKSVYFLTTFNINKELPEQLFVYYYQNFVKWPLQPATL